MKKALVLLSGGLDSLLAYKIIEREGLDVIGVHYINPITTRDPAGAAKIFEVNNLDYLQKSNFPEFLALVKKPQYGYGKFLNPCIDCRILNIELAAKDMKVLGADFLVTGEVIGQRPKSQFKSAMNLIKKVTGIGDLLLRPLSAKLLDPTLPEREGWINRDHLYDFKGRGRKPQLKLARELGIEKFTSPGGGCPLTLKEYSRKFQDLLDHDMADELNAKLLNLGRHFRLSDKLKLIVGRNYEDNMSLLKELEGTDSIIIDEVVKGPIGVLIGDANDSDIYLASRIISRYTKETEEIKMKWRRADSDDWSIFSVTPFNPDEILKFRI